MARRSRRAPFTTTATLSPRVSVISVSDQTTSDCFTQVNKFELGISVDDLEAACDRFESLKVNFKKRLTDGRMHNIAFILDPDGYWIEVVQNQGIKRTGDW